MKKLSIVLANYVYQSDSGMSLETYQYGLQVALEMLTGITASICIAVYLGMESESLLFLALFSVLRSYAGGLHFSGFGKCFLCSSALTAAVLLFVKFHTIPVFWLWTMMFVMTAAFYIAEPADSRNKSVTGEESDYYKGRLKRALAGVNLLFGGMMIGGLQNYAELIAATMTLTFVLLLVGRWKERYEGGVF